MKTTKLSRTCCLYTLAVLSIYAFGFVATASCQTMVAATEIGYVTGMVTDQRGDPIPGATVSLIEPAGENPPSMPVDETGSFTVPAEAGSFELELGAPGFDTTTVHGELQIKQKLNLGTFLLAIHAATTEVRVTVTQQELAQEEIKVEETQRILGVIPNFLVTYDPHPVPLRAIQKYELAFRTVVDPETIGVDLLSSGIQQGTGGLKAFGAGAQGYAKRFAASYATSSVDTMLGSAVLPSLFKQDPRYFYKGTASVKQRALYAMSMSVVCKGDNGHWQYNYSGLLGGLAAGSLSKFYDPPANRNGLHATLENTAIGIGSSAVTNLFQEFLIRKLSRGAKK